MSVQLFPQLPVPKMSINAGTEVPVFPA
ncbi:unnamed protein product, partial [Allacma fusca]